MDGAWHRLGVFLELREDPDSAERRKAERSRQHWVVWVGKGVLGLGFLIAVGVLVCCGLALIVHLVLGDASPHRVFISGLRLFGAVWGVAFVVFVFGRWVYWIADRWVSKEPGR